MDTNSSVTSLITQMRVIGSAYFIISFVGLCFNSIFMVAVMRSKTIRQSTFFQSAFNLCIVDSLSLIVFAFYVAPATIVPGIADPTEVLQYTINLILIFIPSSLQLNISPQLTLVLAINRYVAICVPTKYNTLFSGVAKWALLIGPWIIGFIVSIAVVFPCCFYWYEPSMYGYSGEQNDVSFAYNMGVLPGFFFLCLIPTIVLHLLIYVNVKKRKQKKVVNAASASDKEERRRQTRDLKLNLQLFGVTAISLFCAIALDFFPFIFSVWYIGVVITIIQILTCSSNGFIYIFMDESIQDEVRKMLKIHKSQINTGNTAGTSVTVRNVVVIPNANV